RGSANNGILALTLALFALCGTSCETVDPSPLTRKGPLPTRSEMPLSRLFPQMPLESARVEATHETLASGTLSYTSVFSQSGDPVWFAEEDGELLVGGLSARHGVGAGMELGVEVPVMYTTSGFLDSFIHSYHNAFGLPQGGRDNEVNDQFSCILVHDGKTAWQL